MSEQVDGFLHYDYNVDWTESLSQLMVFYIAIIHPRSRCTLTWATPLFLAEATPLLRSLGNTLLLFSSKQEIIQR